MEFTLGIMALVFIIGLIMMTADALFGPAKKTVSDMPQPARFGCSMLGMLVEVIVFFFIGIVILTAIFSSGQ